MPRHGQHIILITLSGLRYDVARAAFVARRLPILSRYLPETGWELRQSLASLAYSAHHGLLTGFLPAPIGKTPKRNLLSDWDIETTEIVTSLAAQGYKTICIGGLDCLDGQTVLSQVLPNLFQVHEWCEEFDRNQADSTLWQVRCALHHLRQLNQQPVFLLLNVSATDSPHSFYLPDCELDNAASQQAALEYVDAALAPLFSELEHMGGAFAIMCADHGTEYAENKAGSSWEIPYAEFEINALGRRRQAVSLTFNGNDLQLGHDAEAQFASCLQRFAEHENFELWLNIEQGPAIAMLRNQGWACLLYMRHAADAGFTSCSHDELDGMVEFQLANGQVDEYPLRWCIDFDLCYKALAYFFVNHGAQAEWVRWEQMA